MLVFTFLLYGGLNEMILLFRCFLLLAVSIFAFYLSLCLHPDLSRAFWYGITESLKIYKTTEYLRMKGVLDSVELRMLRRADYMRERNILGESHVYSYGTPSVLHIGWEIGRADSLLSLAFATRWNPKHPSYVSIRLFCNSISQLCCGEQTI